MCKNIRATAKPDGQTIGVHVQDPESIREDHTVYLQLSVDDAVRVATELLNQVAVAKKLRAQRQEAVTYTKFHKENWRD